MLSSAHCLFRNLVVFMRSVWFLSLVLPIFCVCALYLYRLLNRNECHKWFKFRNIYFCFKSCIFRLRRSKLFFTRRLARFAQSFTLALSFCALVIFSLQSKPSSSLYSIGHRFFTVITDVLSPSLSFLVHLRSFSFSLLHDFAVSLSALTPCLLLDKLFWSPSNMILHDILRRVRVSENSVESCFLGLSDAEEGALLSQTLVGLDLNPEIEKTVKLVLAIYREVVGKEQELDDFKSCLLASKLWLEKHMGRFPSLVIDWAESHCDNMELLYDRLGDYGLDSFKILQGKGICVCVCQSRDLPAFQQGPF